MTPQLTKKNTCGRSSIFAVYGYENDDGIEDYNTTWTLREVSINGGKTGGGVTMKWTKTCRNSFLDWCRN
jgi:hypothetical protein